MKRFEGTDAVTNAKNDVLSRMSGCGGSECVACRANNKAIDDLVSAVVTSTLLSVVKTAAEEAGNDLTV